MAGVDVFYNAVSQLSGMKWRDRISNAWWTIVARVNRRAYLDHVVYHGYPLDNPDDFDAIEELLCLETNEWTRRGAKVNVWVGNVPQPEGYTVWKTADDGSRYIAWETLLKFRKIVEDAEYEKARRRREGREMWVKYFTAVAAALAALASFANLYFSYRKK